MFESNFVESTALEDEVMVWIEKRGQQEPSFEEVDPKLGPRARDVWNMLRELSATKM